jgi:hypothetical protein
LDGGTIWQLNAAEDELHTIRQMLPISSSPGGAFFHTPRGAQIKANGLRILARVVQPVSFGTGFATAGPIEKRSAFRAVQ